MHDAPTRPIDADTAFSASGVAKPATPMRLGARDRTHAGWSLGPNETIIWEGRPAAVRLAIRAFRLPVVAAYFGALAAWGSADVLLGRGGIGTVAMPLGSGALTLLVLLGLALVIARTTTYRVTTDRIIIRYGAILTRSLSIPFKQIAALHLSVERGGRGDIAFSLKPGNRIPYLKLWPHVRPWHLRDPEPMFCALPDAALTATQLARRLGSRTAKTPPARNDPGARVANQPSSTKDTTNLEP